MPNSSESQPTNDTAKKSITTGEWIKDNTTWELLDDSVMIDDVINSAIKKQTKL